MTSLYRNMLIHNHRAWLTRNLGEFLGCRDDVVSYDHYRSQQAHVYTRILDLEDQHDFTLPVRGTPEETLALGLYLLGIIPHAVHIGLENKAFFRRRKNHFTEDENGNLKLIWEEA